MEYDKSNEFDISDKENIKVKRHKISKKCKYCTYSIACQKRNKSIIAKLFGCKYFTL